MKKTLIALAVAGVVAAPAAMADVTVYGQANVSIAQQNDGSKGYTAVNSNSSRFGLKAAESLDGGLTAVAQMEFGVAMDSNSAASTTAVDANGDPASVAGPNITARNQFVGLAGGFGTVLAGRHDAPIKMSTGALDVFADTVGDYNAIVGVNGAADVRADNAIAYVAPAMAGATVVLAYVPDEKTHNDADARSAAVMWGAGPLSVDFGYLSTGRDFKLSGTAAGFVKDASSAGGDIDGATAEVTTWRVGAGYAVSDALKIGAIYENLEAAKINHTNLKLKFNSYLVNAAFNMGGGNTIKAEYGQLSGDSKNADTTAAAILPAAPRVLDKKSTLMAVGLDHAFSKNTTGYVVYAKMDNDKTMASSLGVNGSGANIKAADFGKDPSSVEVGMVVKF